MRWPQVSASVVIFEVNDDQNKVQVKLSYRSKIIFVLSFYLNTALRKLHEWWDFYCPIMMLADAVGVSYSQCRLSPTLLSKSCRIKFFLDICSCLHSELQSDDFFTLCYFGSQMLSRLLAVHPCIAHMPLRWKYYAINGVI